MELVRSISRLFALSALGGGKILVVNNIEITTSAWTLKVFAP